MIIVRSPLRITLGGGGTDLPSYYREHGGFLIAAAIDRYVYITVYDIFTDEFVIRYSQNEKVTSIDVIRHPIVREACRLVGLEHGGIEIVSMADIPAGTGLGSSGSFTTALLKALYTHQRQPINSADLAERACHIEIDVLKDPIGKQDQYIAAIGGVTCLSFDRTGRVDAKPLRLDAEARDNLENSLMLFFTGFSRSAGSILKEQDEKTKQADPDMIGNLHYVKELGLRSRKVLESGQFDEFGALMHEHWLHKRKRSAGMSNPKIDAWYELALANGATGGKLIGAGGGGFLMFQTSDRRRLRHAMAGAGLREVRFRFDFEGTKVITQ
jgi:D-glycero-alpha-D-manno-heptose-7-phosphate kinase